MTAIRIEARSDETAQRVRPAGREPGPSGIAHTSLSVGNQSSHKALAKWGSASVERMIECPNCGSRFRCGCDDHFTNSPGGPSVSPISGSAQS